MAQIKTNLQYGVTGSLQTASVANDAIGLAQMASGTDGNIITYDASGNPAVGASGTSGHFLKSQGSNTVPVFAAAGGGKLLQAVTTVSSTDVDITSGTYADLISADITPAHTSNKVLILFSAGCIHLETASDGSRDYVNILRDSTTVKETKVSRWGHVNSAQNPMFANMMLLDAPNTTSQVNYSIQVKKQGATGYATIWGSDNIDGTNCISLICIEIDGT